MKNIFLTFLLITIAGFNNSCTNEKTSFVSANGLVANAVGSIASPTILTDATIADNFAKFTWEQANNGVPSESSYVLSISDKDADPEFKNTVEYSGIGIKVTPTSREAVLTVDEMNVLINKLPSFNCNPMNIVVRVKSTLGINPTSSFIQYSNSINYKITGFPKTQQILAFSSSTSNLNNATKLKSSTFKINSDFEGYAYLTAGNYKFYKPDACGDFTNATIISKGLATNTLSLSGTDFVLTEGYYLIKANLLLNTYSIKEYKTFGINGDGTRTGFGTANIIPMEDPEKDNIWTLTIGLIKAKKFRFQSNMWNNVLLTPGIAGNLAYIPSSSITSTPSILGFLSATELIEVTTLGDITVPGTFNANEKDNFIVTIDVKNPRKYIYSLVKI